MLNNIEKQYAAAVEMLLQTVDACTEQEWLDCIGQNPCWKVAYHALFYADLYLCLSEQEFRLPSPHYADAQFLGTSPYPPFKAVSTDNPISKTAVIAFGREVLQHTAIIGSRTHEELEAPSGFPWTQLTNGELLLMSMRHIQHHTSQIQLHIRDKTEWLTTASGA